MDIKDVQKIEEPLLSRTKITGELHFSGATPSNDDLKKKLAQNLKANEELVVIKRISTGYGQEKATFIAYLYVNKEEMKKIEPKKKEKEKKPGEEKKEVPKEGVPKEEKPKEKLSEESKKEEKAPTEEKPKEEVKKE